VTVTFSGSDARRNYLVAYLPPRGNGKGKATIGRWAVVSIKHPGPLPFSNFDLRSESFTPDPDGRGGVDGWRETLAYLENYPQTVLDSLLKDGRPVPG
jgi:hypothetical protein